MDTNESEGGRSGKILEEIMSPNFPIFMKTLTPRSKQKLSIIDMKKTTPKKSNCPKPEIERKILKAPREKRHFTGNEDKDTVTQKQMKLEEKQTAPQSQRATSTPAGE